MCCQDSGNRSTGTVEYHQRREVKKAEEALKKRRPERRKERRRGKFEIRVRERDA